MDIEGELERVIEKNKNRQYSTFETRVDLVAQDCLQEIRRLKDVIEFFQNQEGWISVEDRLPNNLHTVLFYAKYDGHRMGYFNGTIWVCMNYGEFSQKAITHWMPLPKPPKEVKI